MLSRSFFPNFGQGPFPKIARKGPGMLPSPFSFIWVLQMQIGNSTFQINIYLSIFVFQLGIFVNVKTYVLTAVLDVTCCSKLTFSRLEGICYKNNKPF